nr:hypothetical protein [Tanacetum cinerariifolium]
MVVHVPPVMSPGLSAGIAEVAAMSNLAFCKRFRSSYDSSSSPTLPVRKRYRGTYELILGTDSKEDEEVEESLDSDSESEEVEDEGPTSHGVDGKSYGLDDESYGLDDESYGVDGESYGLDDESRGIDDEDSCERAFRTWVWGVEYRELELEEDHVYSTFEVGQGSGSAPEPERSERVSAFRQSTLTTWTDPKDGMIYINVHVYPPPAPPVQKPP